jgi:hypothetical protein
VLLAVDIVGAIVEALSFAFGMFSEILWALILGFFLSAVVQAVVCLALTAVLVWRFLRTGGFPMLKEMNKPAEAHGHAH